MRDSEGDIPQPVKAIVAHITEVLQSVKRLKSVE